MLQHLFWIEHSTLCLSHSQTHGLYTALRSAIYHRVGWKVRFSFSSVRPKRLPEKAAAAAPDQLTESRAFAATEDVRTDSYKYGYFEISSKRERNATFSHPG